MDSNKFMEVVSKHIDQNFNSNNQLVDYVVTELKAGSFSPLYGYRLGLISSPPFKYGIIKIKRLEKSYE